MDLMNYLYKAMDVKLSVLLFYVLVVVFSQPNFASTEQYRFTHLTGKDGLPHQQVQTLMQDDKGILWIGTKSGLSTYNGYEIKSYFHRPENDKSLRHNFVVKTYQDKHKRIWIGTKTGICRYIPDSDNFKCYNHEQMVIANFFEDSDSTLYALGIRLYKYNAKSDSFEIAISEGSEVFRSGIIDSKDRIYLSTVNSLTRYSKDLLSSTQLNYNVLKPFFNATNKDVIIPMYSDANGHLWLARNNVGILKFHPDSLLSEVWNPVELSDGTIRVFSEDAAGNMWVGTEKGITIISSNKNIKIIQQNYLDPYALNDNPVYDILHDKDRNTWIGTYFGGINILLKSYEQFSVIRAGYDNFSLRGKAVRKILEIDKQLWIATEDGGLNVYDLGSKKIEHIEALNYNVHELYYDKSTRTIWIGTFLSGLYEYDLATQDITKYTTKSYPGLPSDAIFSITKGKDHTLWIGTTNGLRYFDKQSSEFKSINHPTLDIDFVYTLFIDAAGNLWVGTLNYGLFKISHDTKNIVNWSKTKNNEGLQDNYITGLYETTDGTIWIGTNNGGLHYMSPGNNHIIQFKKDPFLQDKSICAMLEDDENQLWISTHAGLLCWNHDIKTLERYTIDEGLPVNQFNYSSALKASNGQFYFGTINGLISFNPKSISPPSNTLNVVLTTLSINNKTVTASHEKSPLSTNINATNHIKLSYKQSRSFFIEYVAISLGHTNIINYAVKLEGRDDDWIMVGNERKIVCSNLPPGEYTLKIKANNTFNHWEDAPVKSIKIEIAPHFLQSTIAFVVYFLFTLLLIFGINSIIITRIRQKDAIKVAHIENEKIQELNQLRTDFFTSISHELKTPLSLIVAPLKYLAESTGFKPEITKRIDYALRNALRMVGLIDELTTLNKVDAGQMNLNLYKGNPLEFINNLIELYYENIYHKKLTLNVRLEDNGEDVWFSPSFLEKIVNNLVSNAIKFTPEGGYITIKGAIDEKENSQTYLKITVLDSGIGIIQSEQEHIFDYYYQTRRGHKENAQGWGVGLSLTKKLVNLHKGYIDVESSKGEGAKFTVELNVSESAFAEDLKTNLDLDNTFLKNYTYSGLKLQQASKGKKEFSLEAINPLKQTLLIVDDNQELTEFMHDIFSNSYRVLIAKDGLIANSLVQKEDPDLIISDVMMPNMNGFELCNSVKSNILTSHIPVILLTAKTDPQDIIEGYKYGADIYLEKPFDPKALELQVSNMLKLKKQSQKEMQTQMRASEKLQSFSKKDEQFIKKLNSLIEANIANELFQVSDITKALAISRTVLHVKMKNLMDMPISDYIRKKRLYFAQKLISQGHNFSEASFMSGFSNQSYFTKCFKKEFGLTPSEFINSQNN